MACHALLLRKSHVQLLARSLEQRLGPEWTCADLSLRLRQAGHSVAVAAASAMFWPGPEQQSALGLPPAQPPAAFLESWRQQLWQLHNRSQEVRRLCAGWLPGCLAAWLPTACLGGRAHRWSGPPRSAHQGAPKAPNRGC